MRADGPALETAATPIEAGLGVENWTESRDNTCRRDFRFFDTRVHVFSDIPEMLDLLDAMFADFAIEGADRADGADGALPPDTLVCSMLEGRGKRAEIRIGGRRYRVARRDVVGLGYMVLFQATLRRIQSHLLLHAGALESAGRGVLLVGDSGAGKSTLVMELVRRGFKLLSDDIGAVRLADGLLEPFPRSLGFVPKGEGDRGGLGGPTDIPCELSSSMPLIGGGEKLLVRPEALRPALGRVCTPALLIFLPGGAERSDSRESLHVVFNELPVGLRRRLDDLSEVTGVEDVPNRLFPELRFRTRHAGRTLRQVDAACAQYSTAILETSRGETRAEHCDADPELIPLSKGEASRLLLRQLHVTQDSELIRKVFAGSGARLLRHLAGLVRGMRCATLTVGRLDLRADWVARALDAIELDQKDEVAHDRR